MPIRIDPEEVELRALRPAASWRHARVLEIGCGDGRLTRRLARLGAQVIAIDPDRNAIRSARKTLPKSYARQVRYAVGTAGRLEFPARSFDIVVFAWSL
jgi:2-polyprenyl-3-methyl-5-hydroxy-6-metoxy-1,4-benzoquinol methylase